MPESSLHPLDPLVRLMQTLRQRAASRPAGSYTTTLLNGGLESMGAKIREEAEELIEAAREPARDGKDPLVHEAADLLFHTCVLLAWRDLDLQAVAEELARREGVSGLVEKAQRTTPPGPPPADGCAR